MKRRKKKKGGQGTPDTGEERTFANRPFAGLDKKSASPGPSPKKRPEKIQEPSSTGAPPMDDDSFYDRAMADVEELSTDRARVGREPKAKPLLLCEDEEALVMKQLDELVHGVQPFDFADTDEFIQAAVAGFDRRVLRKLRRGEYAIQGHIDLHGCNRAEAREQVAAFIRRSYEENKRCVLIVHGRGLGSKDNIPVLKNKLANWLTRGSIGKKVLAFTSARPYDGGTGAVYVLLRS